MSEASTALVTGANRGLGREISRQLAVRVNSMCPGWVMTDMGHADLPDCGDEVRPQTKEEAVRELMWLTELPPDGPTGAFFSGGERVAW